MSRFFSLLLRDLNPLRCALIIISKSDYPACNKAHVRERGWMETGLNIHRRSRDLGFQSIYTHPAVLFSHRVLCTSARARLSDEMSKCAGNREFYWQTPIIVAGGDCADVTQFHGVSLLSRIDLVGCYCTSRLTCPCAAYTPAQTAVLERK